LYKTISIKIRKNIKIIDTPGNQEFVNVTRTFLKGIGGGFIVFYLTDRNSFGKINDWTYELKRSQDAQITLISNEKNQYIEGERKISKK
jgi:GTPase SAR1 family protein